MLNAQKTLERPKVNLWSIENHRQRSHEQGLPSFDVGPIAPSWVTRLLPQLAMLSIEEYSETERSLLPLAYTEAVQHWREVRRDLRSGRATLMGAFDETGNLIGAALFENESERDTILRWRFLRPEFRGMGIESALEG